MPMTRKPKTMTRATPWTHPFEIASSALVALGFEDCSVIAIPPREVVHDRSVWPRYRNTA